MNQLSQVISDGMVDSWAVRSFSTGQVKDFPAAVMARVGSGVTLPRREWGMD